MGGREVRGDGREGEVDKRGRGHRGGSVVPYRGWGRCIF